MEAIKPSSDLFSPKECHPAEIQIADFSTAPEITLPETVQLVEILQLPPPSRIRSARIDLDSVVSAPVGRCDTPGSQSAAFSLASDAKVTSDGKTSRHTPVSAADATLKEEIKLVLAGPSSPDIAMDGNSKNFSERRNLPVGKASPPEVRHNEPNSATASNSSSSPASSVSSQEDSTDFQVQKTFEVIRLLRERGYTIQKDPNRSPKTQNAVSVASNKSERKFPCLRCTKFKGRPCELR